MVLAGKQKRESDSLGMELQRVVTLSMGSGDRVWFLWKSRQCTGSPSLLSSLKNSVNF